MDKTEIQRWLSDTDFEGSVLLRFAINEKESKIELVTVHYQGQSQEYQYKFNRTEFEGVADMKRSVGVTIHQKSPNLYQAGQDSGTIVIETLILRSYHSTYQLELDFGHNFGTCSFQFHQMKAALKKGKVTKRKQEEVIIDIQSNKVIVFDKPFKAGVY